MISASVKPFNPRKDWADKVREVVRKNTWRDKCEETLKPGAWIYKVRSPFTFIEGGRNYEIRYLIDFSTYSDVSKQMCDFLKQDDPPEGYRFYFVPIERDSNNLYVNAIIVQMPPWAWKYQ